MAPGAERRSGPTGLLKVSFARLSLGKTRAAEFSSQEDSGPDNTVRVALVICALSLETALMECHTVFDAHIQ